MILYLGGTMQVTNVSQNDLRNNRFIIPKRNHYSNISFEKAFVATTQAYASKEIRNVVDVFNKDSLPEILTIAKKRINKKLEHFYSTRGIKKPLIKNADYFAEKCNCIVLGGGPGSRFQSLSKAVGTINGGKEYNKICVPFATKEGSPDFTMLHPALAMQAICAAGTKTKSGEVIDYGYHIYEKAEERGTFWHTMDYYMKNPDEIKDTIIMSGDNAFDVKSETLLKGMALMKEGGHHLLMFGVQKAPKDCAGELGVLGVQKVFKAEGGPKRERNYRSLNTFVEKPPIEVAQKMAEETGGVNIANTGALIISKEAIQRMVEIAKKEEPEILKKLELQKSTGKEMDIRGSFSRERKGKVDPKDMYDFSTVQKWILDNMYTKKQVKQGQGPLVYMIDSKKWNDVGKPSNMIDMLQDASAKGSFLRNFPEKTKKMLREVFQNKLRTGADGSKVLLVTNRYNSLDEVPQKVIKKTPSLIDEKTQQPINIKVVG